MEAAEKMLFELAAVKKMETRNLYLRYDGPVWALCGRSCMPLHASVGYNSQLTSGAPLDLDWCDSSSVLRTGGISSDRDSQSIPMLFKIIAGL
jgi:hypothetical protein